MDISIYKSIKNLDLLNKAIIIATISHSSQVDKGGIPYIFHPIRVMLSLSDENEKIVGILHDVIEDTDITLMNLSELGFNKLILQAIKSITRKEDESYMNFIKRCHLNNLATNVKLMDLNDNMDLGRIKNT